MKCSKIAKIVTEVSFFFLGLFANNKFFVEGPGIIIGRAGNGIFQLPESAYKASMDAFESNSK